MKMKSIKLESDIPFFNFFNEYIKMDNCMKSGLRGFLKSYVGTSLICKAIYNCLSRTIDSYIIYKHRI